LIVLDTTVLSYAVGSDHPLREPCARLVAAIGERSVDASTTVDVVQEFAHAFARRRTRAAAAAQAQQYATLLSPLLSPGTSELLAGLRLFEQHEALDAFDGVLAATALAAGAEALVSADRAFGAIRGLRHVDPAGGAFDDLFR
jgi:uncharacterized protein